MRQNAWNPKRSPWGRLRAAPMPKRGPGLSKKADRDAYDLAHLAWRAGAVTDFYYGRRSPEDPTIVWRIESADYQAEYNASERDRFVNIVRKSMSARGIAELAWGESWCGYREVVVTFTSGVRVGERYNGRTVELTEERIAA